MDVPLRPVKQWHAYWKINVRGQGHQAVPAGAKEVTFHLHLRPGKTRLQTLFISEDGTEHGAYFVYVTRN